MNDPQEKLKNQLVKKPENLKPEQVRYNTVAGLVQSWAPLIKQTLPRFATPERMTRLVLTALRMNLKLTECAPASLFGAVMQCCQLGLEPGPLGHAYLIPRRIKGQMECQFQIGYKGLLDLFYRHPLAKVAFAFAVHENDTFTYELGLEPFIEHKPADGDRGALTHVYAVLRLTSGAYGFSVMSKAEVDQVKAKSESAGSPYSPWNQHYEAMALKTVLKRALKYMPLSIEIESAIAQDETVKAVEPDRETIDAGIDMSSVIDLTAEDQGDQSND